MFGFSPPITENLTKVFEVNPKPSHSLCQELAEKNGLRLQQVKSWFEGRRRRKQHFAVTKEQSVILLDAYHKHGSNLSERVYANLAHKLALTREQVVSWFESISPRRRTITKAEEAMLREHLSRCRYPSRETIASLAGQFGTTEYRVRQWLWKLRAKQAKSSDKEKSKKNHLKKHPDKKRAVLMHYWTRFPYPSDNQIDYLTQKLNLSRRQIFLWFQQMQKKHFAGQEVHQEKMKNELLMTDDSDDDDQLESASLNGTRKSLKNCAKQHRSDLSSQASRFEEPIVTQVPPIAESSSSFSVFSPSNMLSQFGQMLGQTLGGFLQSMLSLVQGENQKMLGVIQAQVATLDQSVNYRLESLTREITYLRHRQWNADYRSSSDQYPLPYISISSEPTISYTST